MKLSFRLTLEGMVRALRMRAHAAAERRDEDEARPSREPVTGPRGEQRRPRRRETDHDRSRA